MRRELCVFRASAPLAHFFIDQCALMSRELHAPKTNLKRRITMDNYKELYLILFNAITDATKILQEAQKKAEDLFINQ